MKQNRVIATCSCDVCAGGVRTHNCLCSSPSDGRLPEFGGSSLGEATMSYFVVKSMLNRSKVRVR